MSAAKAFRFALGALGVAVMGIAALGILRDRSFTDPPGLAVWLGAGVIAHDFILAPLSLLIGFIASRLVPHDVRHVVGYGLATAAVILVVGVPVLLASHRDRANPTIMNQNYGVGLMIAELVVLVATGLTAFVLLRRRAEPS